jgi:hypothetical protein
VATSTIWSQIFFIKSLEDIQERLKTVYSKIDYLLESSTDGWFKDQTDLYRYLMNWHEKTNGFIALNDKTTGHNRLCRYNHRYLITDKAKNDRNTRQGQMKILKMISDGQFSDYHCCRPYKKYEQLNKKLISMLVI